MIKSYLLLILLGCSFLSFSQNKKWKAFECLVVNNKTDTTKLKVYNFDKHDVFNPYFVHNGFKAFGFSDEKEYKIKPQNYSYFIIKDSINGDQKFKSINKQLNKNKKPKYVFMAFTKEHSKSELKMGEINVYGCQIQGRLDGYKPLVLMLYLEDKNGLHYIKTKKERVKYLGKEGNNIFNSLKNKLKLPFFANNGKHPEYKK